MDPFPSFSAFESKYQSDAKISEPPVANVKLSAGSSTATAVSPSTANDVGIINNKQNIDINVKSLNLFNALPPFLTELT